MKTFPTLKNSIYLAYLPKEGNQNVSVIDLKQSDSYQSVALRQPFLMLNKNKLNIKCPEKNNHKKIFVCQGCEKSQVKINKLAHLQTRLKYSIIIIQHTSRNEDNI